MMELALLLTAAIAGLAGFAIGFGFSIGDDRQ